MQRIFHRHTGHSRKGHRHPLWGGLLFIIYYLFISPAGAQTLFEKDLQTGLMFQQSGNQTMAERYLLTARKNANDKNAREQLDVQLAIVDLYKFWQPVTAQRLNDDLAALSQKFADTRLKHLALDACISFRLNNKTAFDQAYKEYVMLCQQNDSLPTVYDDAIKAMHEAMDGFYDQALSTLKTSSLSKLCRHDLRIIILGMTDQQAAVIDELQARSATIDSLSAALYDTNLSEMSIATGMTLAHQQAAQSRQRLRNVIMLLAAAIIVMLAVWAYMRRRHQKHLENKNSQLRAALKMAGETDQMKTEFVRRVSHEIRTPLNAISGFNDVLNNSGMELSADERNDLKNRINDNVKAITNIVDEMLQMANDASLQDYAKYDTVMCNQFFSELLYRHSQQVGSRIELKYTTKVINRFTFVTNAEIVEKIVEHLIDNAIKFTKHGHIELNCREQKGMVYITVSDTGRGIPADKQDEIFEQFAKADAFQQGIGLGLTVSRKIAQKLGGDLVLDKHYTTGASFVLSLPVK